MKHDFEERREKRIKNAENQAKKNKEEAESLYKSAQKMASSIPFGQPILVGHHSEKRDRNYRNRIHNTFGKSFEKMNKAAYYEGKIDGIQNDTSIYSDDPNAVEKLSERLDNLKALQDFMKSANKCIKKKDKEAFLKLPNASQDLWEKLNTPDCFKCIGFASYKLRNNNANIRRIENRIAHLTRNDNRAEVDKTINGVRIYENKRANRLQMFFDSKPSSEFRKRLKKHGFRWSPQQTAWQRHIGNDAYHSAITLAESLGAVQ